MKYADARVYFDYFDRGAVSIHSDDTAEHPLPVYSVAVEVARLSHEQPLNIVFRLSHGEMRTLRSVIDGLLGIV